MRAFAPSSALLLLATLTAAQVGNQDSAVTLIGTVVDSSSGAPLNGAIVWVSAKRGDHRALTDSAGKFRLPGVSRDLDSIHVSRIGYRPLAIGVQLRDQRTSTVQLGRIVLHAPALGFEIMIARPPDCPMPTLPPNGASIPMPNAGANRSRSASMPTDTIACHNSLAPPQAAR